MYACIDLGSNSFHLLIARWNRDEIQLVERCSVKVQLGEGVQSSGKISPQAFERGLETLRHFQTLIKQHSVQRYWALGTNTFRIAGNASTFVDAAVSFGIEISIISGVQEAVLIYAGVISALEDTDDKRLVIDIGGGSTELIVGHHQQRLITHSLPIGCVSWRDKYFSQAGTDARALSDAMDKATTAAAAVFNKVAPAVNRYDLGHSYASSGTAKMLTAICHEHGVGDGELTLDALERLRGLMVDAISSGEELPGLKPKRRDLLLPGCAVMTGLMRAFPCQSIVFSSSALREGMLDFMISNRKTVQAQDSDNLPDVSYAGS
ncbi:MAG: hypothetical protein JKY98_01985 [Gammaproteobacteria bacterium]|nr:hypothetical protein [Gammaproteobacteria bacterium]